MANFYAIYSAENGGGGGGSGDVVGPASSDNNGLVLFDGTTGKLIKEATGTGIVKITSGVASVLADPLPIANGGTNSSTALNNNRVMQSSGGKIQEAAAITAARALISDANGIPTQSVTTATELSYVNGVTSSIQTQLDGKQATGNYITALTSDVTASGPGSVAATIAAGAVTNTKIAAAAGINVNKLEALTASRAVVTDGSGFISAATTTSTEIGYVNGVTSAIQTQLNGKQASDATLTALAAYNTNGLMTQTAADTFTGRTVTGTTNRISVSNGDGVSGNPTIDISSSYVGQNTITTLGTITTGTWTGTTVAIANGGTGQTSASNAFNALSPNTTKGDITVYSTTNARLAVGTNNYTIVADSAQTLGVKWMDLLDSANMSDAQATAMGLYEYLSSGTYNGGLSPTTTSGAGGFSLARAVYVPYKMKDGTWRLRFNVAGTLTSAAGLTISITGITSKNVTDFRQSFALYKGGFGRIDPNSSDLNIDFSPNSNQFSACGDIELNAKPTWAY